LKQSNKPSPGGTKRAASAARFFSGHRKTRAFIKEIISACFHPDQLIALRIGDMHGAGDAEIEAVDGAQNLDWLPGPRRVARKECSVVAG
jgi:hypothetical protein